MLTEDELFTVLIGQSLVHWANMPCFLPRVGRRQRAVRGKQRTGDERMVTSSGVDRRGESKQKMPKTEKQVDASRPHRDCLCEDALVASRFAHPADASSKQSRNSM